MQAAKVLSGHTSESTAYVVDDYPYGWNKRCKIRFWIETNLKGQRVVAQTTNPDKPGEEWNKPKRTSYAQIRVLFLDANTGYVEHAFLSEHATKKEVDAFLNRFGAENFTDDYSCKTLELMRKYRQLMMERFANDATITQVGVPESNAEASGE